MGKYVRRPAALHWVNGEITRLEQQRANLVDRMTRDGSDIDGIDLLLGELEQIREEC